MSKKYFILLVFWVTLFGCTTQRKTSRYLDRNPIFAAKECAVRFPIKETIDTITIQDNELLEAYEKEFTYLYSILDSVLGQQVSDSIKEKIVTVFQERKVPVIEYRYITKTVENTAKYQVLLDSCKGSTDKLSSVIKDKEKLLSQAMSIAAKQGQLADKYKEQRNRNYWWILLLLIALFRKPIWRAIRKLVTKS